MLNAAANEDNSPSASFQKLCQNVLDGSSRNLTKKNVEDFRVILHMIMHECSKANIETGKHWVFDHCHSSAHIAALMNYIYSLTKSRSGQEERIHMLYLINDVVYHISRKQLTWMKDAILPLLTPFLKLVYDGATTPELKAKVTKVINFWYTKKTFESDTIDAIKRDVTGQLIPDHLEKLSVMDAPLPSPQPQAYQPQQTRLPPTPIAQQYRPISSPGPAQAPIIEKPYYEMPAGLMLLSKSNSYEPLDPALIKIPYPRPAPTKELITAVDDFYAGMELVNADDVILNDKHGQNNKDTQGWEKGYLDGYREALLQQKKDELERQKLMSASKQHHAPPPMASMSRDVYNRRHSPGFSSGSRSRSGSRSPSRGRGRAHARGRGRERSYSYSRSHSRSRSYSPDYRHHHSSNNSNRRSRRSYSRSHSRSPPPRFRGGGRRGSPPPYRGRSPPRGRSPSGRGRRPSPPPHPTRGYNNRSYEQQRRYSRSPSPPSSSSFRPPPPPSSSMHSNISYPSSMNPTTYNASNQYQQNRGAGAVTGGVGSVGGSNFDNLPPAVPAENRYMGLGSKSLSSTLDEFDSFRKNKSHAFSNREPHQPFTCYKCNKVGHLARECTSL